MAPIRIYTDWNKRSSDHEETIEPYRKYFFICEGANTETFYFQKLIDLRKTLGIHSLIDIRLIEKTEGDRDISYPRKLIEFADAQKDLPELSFDPERDKMIVVFDTDIFNAKVEDYESVVALGEQKNILGVTNPAFELFLLLHFKDSYETDILPNTEAILKNEKIGSQRYIYTLLHARTGMNSKRNRDIGELARNVSVTIEQEKKLNQDAHSALGSITCNIGSIIQAIREDQNVG